MYYKFIKNKIKKSKWIILLDWRKVKFEISVDLIFLYSLLKTCEKKRILFCRTKADNKERESRPWRLQFTKLVGSAEQMFTQRVSKERRCVTVFFFLYQ